MSKKTKILLIILLVIILAASWFVYTQWNNISAVINSFRYSQEEVEENIKNTKEDLQKIIDEDDNITVRDLTEEEAKALNEGKMTEEEAVDILTAKPESPPKHEDQNSSLPEKKPETTTNNSSQAVSQAIAKLYIQKNAYLNKLDAVEAEVRGIYMKMSREEKKTAKKKLLAEYLPKVAAWETECDNTVYGILDEIRLAVKNTGQDETIVKKLEEAYLSEKSMKKTYFINRYMD